MHITRHLLDVTHRDASILHFSSTPAKPVQRTCGNTAQRNLPPDCPTPLRQQSHEAPRSFAQTPFKANPLYLA